MKKMKAKKSDKKAFLQYFENQHEGKLPNYFFHIFVFWSPVLIFDAQIKISYKSYGCIDYKSAK